MGLFAKFKAGLQKTHAKLTHELKRIITRSPKLNAESLELCKQRQAFDPLTGKPAL